MTFRDQLKSDGLNTFLNTGEFAESIKYTPYGGAQKTISAIVDRQRNDTAPETAGRDMIHQMEIWMSNDPTHGISTINRGGDKVILPGVMGGADQTYVVVDILGSDDGMWHLLIER